MALELGMLSGGRVAPPSRILQCAVVWVCGLWLRHLLDEEGRGGGGGAGSINSAFLLVVCGHVAIVGPVMRFWGCVEMRACGSQLARLWGNVWV